MGSDRDKTTLDLGGVYMYMAPSPGPWEYPSPHTFPDTASGDSISIPQYIPQPTPMTPDELRKRCQEVIDAIDNREKLVKRVEELENRLSVLEKVIERMIR